MLKLMFTIFGDKYKIIKRYPLSLNLVDEQGYIFQHLLSFD